MLYLSEPERTILENVFRELSVSELSESKTFFRAGTASSRERVDSSTAEETSARELTVSSFEDASSSSDDKLSEDEFLEPSLSSSGL